MKDDPRFWSKVRKSEEGCWEWTGARSRPGWHGVLGRGPRGAATHYQAHRYSWELHFGPIPDGLWVLHRCDNPPCVRPDHLYLGTPRDNTHDAMRAGHIASGDNHWLRKHPERHHRSTYTADDVRTIRRLRLQGETQGSIARRFGVPSGHIGRILKRERFAWVED